jgi:signal transduction histidine kinase
MKLRLFWTMLLAFSLVIVAGVCGMLAFVSLAAAGIWQPASLVGELRAGQAAYVAALRQQYIASGNSWRGIEQRLSQPPFEPPAAQARGRPEPPDARAGYVLADAQGRVIASADPNVPAGREIERSWLAWGAPIEVNGQTVGTLVVRPGPWFGPGGARPPRDIAWSVGRGFLFTGLGLMAALLALAVLFAGWLNRPLRRMTAATRRLAAGERGVKVGGAAVRELDDLSRAFNAMSDALTDADRQRRQLTADVAHELRTPLTIIKGRLEGIQDGVYQATPEQIARLLEETALLERLIEDLRLLALAEAGQLPLYLEPADPRALLAGAAAAFAEAAQRQGVVLRVDAPDDLPAVAADPQRMAQVLANLVANALRYTPAGGAITLEARAADGQPTADTRIGKERRRQGAKKQHDPASAAPALPRSSPCPGVLLQVRDTGQGIAPDDLPHIFDRFWRADPARARSSGGAGLGLAIARQIVEAHGGCILAESEVGRGTTITILLPATAVAPRSAGPVARP